MKRIKTYQVKELARLSGVSVRTLHHYDEIGLLKPGDRTAAGYRLYGEADLFRLQQILIRRELGMPLEQIRRALDDPGFDHKVALLEQKKLLQQKAQTTEAMLNAIDAALARLTEKEKTVDAKQIFDGFDPAKYEAEAKARWGHTEAFQESMRRTKNYSAADWEKMKAEQVAVYRDAAAAMQAGEKPDGEKAMAIAERARLVIDRWFYPCGHAMHCGLADMYEADARFAENIDKYGAGLTAFFGAAIRANAKRLG